MDEFSRTELIFGKEAMQKLAAARVAVFGLGGVGGYAVEALARSGVGELHLIDNDKVSVTNINRQIYALQSTIGQYKADLARERVLAINPACKAFAHKLFYMPETAKELNFNSFDYIVDAIDTVTGKICIIENAKAANVPVISCMGAGNKTDATAFEVTELFSTSVCPLAKVMRRELKRRNIDGLKVVYSKEIPITPDICLDESGSVRKSVPASVSFVPSVAGLIAAGEVIKELIKL